VFGAELLGHPVDLVDDAPPGVGDRDELEPAVVAPARALDEALALEPLDQRAGGGLAHAEPPREIGLGGLLGAIQMDQRRHLTLVEAGAAEPAVVDPQLEPHQLGEQELELLVRIAALHGLASYVFVSYDSIRSSERNRARASRVHPRREGVPMTAAQF